MSDRSVKKEYFVTGLGLENMNLAKSIVLKKLNFCE
jgi:hypothetical protein